MWKKNNNSNSICTFLQFWYVCSLSSQAQVFPGPGVSGHIAPGESGCPRMRRSEVVALRYYYTTYVLCTTEHNNSDVDQEKVKEWTQGDFVNVSVRCGCRLGQPLVLTTRLVYSRVSNFVLVFQIIFRHI